MNRDRSNNQLPNPFEFKLGDKLNVQDDPHLRKVATTPPREIAEWLRDLIQATPESILKNPPMIPILARNNLHEFQVDAVDTAFVTMTEGPDEVHFSMLFALRGKPASAGSTANTIRGMVNVIFKRREMMVFDVQAAEVLPAETSNN